MDLEVNVRDKRCAGRTDISDDVARLHFGALTDSLGEATEVGVEVIGPVGNLDGDAGARQFGPRVLLGHLAVTNGVDGLVPARDDVHALMLATTRARSTPGVRVETGRVRREDIERRCVAVGPGLDRRGHRMAEGQAVGEQHGDESEDQRARDNTATPA